jgi:hypothetical protein
MLTKESRQVRRARERSLVRKTMTKTERRTMFRRPRSERREIFNTVLNMILSGELRV